MTAKGSLQTFTLSPPVLIQSYSNDSNAENLTTDRQIDNHFATRLVGLL
jgi:hypothetical protein